MVADRSADVGGVAVNARVIQSDFLELMKQTRSESVDLVLTDPPYPSLERWKGIGTTARMGLGRAGSGSDDASKFFPCITWSQLAEFLVQAARILKQNRHCYVMCDSVALPHVYKAIGWQSSWADAKDMGYMNFWSNVKPLIWDKVNAGMGYHYRCRYEFIIMLDKGKNRKLNDLGISDILWYKRIDGKDRLVPTQKPVGLFQTLIKQSTQPGEVVFDPFCGAGTTALAAKSTGRGYIVSDISEKAVEITNKLLSGCPEIKASVAIQRDEAEGQAQAEHLAECESMEIAATDCQPELFRE